jgi:phosphate:Na+ symporter
VSIESSALSENTSNMLATLMRVDQYFLTCSVSIEILASRLESREALTQENFEKKVSEYLIDVHSFMEFASSEECKKNEVLKEQFDLLSAQHDKIKAELIHGATRSQVSVPQMSSAIDCLAEDLRIAQQWFKAFNRIQALETEILLLREMNNG